MSGSGAIKDFKFDGDDGKEQKITRVVPVEQFLVQYYDQEGKQQARLVARDPKSGTAYIINGQIQGQPVIIPATKWFQAQLSENLKGEEEVASV